MLLKSISISELKMKQILANKIRTPDGTILQSFNRHDYKTHLDTVSNETYMVDGGLDYLRRNKAATPYEELSVWDDSPFEEIRENFCWGTRGKDGKQPLTYKPLSTLDTDHIKAIIDTQYHISDTIQQVFISELAYRGEYQ